MAIQDPNDPTIWNPQIEERSYRGEMFRNKYSNRPAGDHDDVTLTSKIRVLLNPFLQQNYGRIKYVDILGCKWTVTSVEIQYPGVIMEIGGVYTGG